MNHYSLFDRVAEVFDLRDRDPSAVRQLAADLGLPTSELLDKAALECALQFLSGHVSYDDAMGFTADIFGAFLTEKELNNHESLAAQIYMALDEGEYTVPSDGDLDPINARAIPALRHVVETFSQEHLLEPPHLEPGEDGHLRNRDDA